MPPLPPDPLLPTVRASDTDAACQELRKTLEATKKELEKTKEELGRNYRRNEARIEELEEENEILRSSAREAKMREVRLTIDNDKLHAEMRKMSKEHADRSIVMSPRTAAATVALEDGTGDGDLTLKWRDLLEKKDVELDEMRNNLEDIKKRLEEKKLLARTLAQSQQNLEDKLIDHQLLNEELEEALATLRSEIAVLKARRSEAFSGMNLADELEGAFAAPSSSMHPDAQNELDLLRAKLAEESERLRDAKGQARKLETRNTKLAERMDELKMQLGTATTKANEASKLAAANKKLVERKEELKTQLVKGAAVVEAHKRLVEQKKDVETRLAEQEKKVYELRKVERQNEKLAAKVTALKSGLLNAATPISSTPSPVASPSSSQNLDGVTREALVSEVKDLRKQLSDMTRKYHDLVKEKRRSVLQVSSLTQQVEMFQKKMDKKPDETPTGDVSRSIFDMALSGMWSEAVSVDESAVSQHRPFTAPLLQSPTQHANRLTVVSGIGSPCASATSGMTERERRRAASGVAPRVGTQAHLVEGEDEDGWMAVMKKGWDQAAISFIRLNGTMTDLVDRKDILGVKSRMQTCKDEEELAVGKTALRLWAAEYLYDVAQDVKSGGDSSLTKIYDAIEDAIEYGVNPKLIANAEKEMANLQKLDDG
eukprot:GEMP01017679.1.p1 GENE.GEMP01017679.1~~GEMP01017679.1.p1  ORF type:complete len:657 (+),score=242.18 GEMP01017679.1:83-2053(+)